MLRATVKLTNSPLENFYTSFKTALVLAINKTLFKTGVHIQ